MHSFFTFAPKDASMLHNLSQLPKFSPTTPFFQASNVANLEIPTLNNFMNHSPVEGRSRISSINSLSSINSYSPISPMRAAPVPMTPEVEGLLMRLKIQQNLQTEVFRKQMQQLLDIKNTLLNKLNEQQRQMDHQAQAHAQAQISQQLLTRSPVAEVQSIQASVKVESPVEVKPSKAISRDLKGQVKDIVEFVLENFGRIGESRIEEEKQKYAFNKELVNVFDILIAKYSSTIKTKEEMVKYTLRRAFKFIKNNLKKETHSNSKGVSKVLCNKYFKPSNDDISKVGDEEGFLKFVLPFRKNSKNKTMNTNFISEVFSSGEFAHDYETYLNNFDAILEADNKGKVEKFISYIEEAVLSNKTKDIKTYKRIPWPKLWIVNTKKIAESLPTIASQGLQSSNSQSPVKKYIKSEDMGLRRDYEELRTNDCRSEASTDSNSNF